MITWWHYFPMIILAALLPFIAGALPTKEFKGVDIGGGPVRQEAINIMANALPEKVGNELVQEFMSASKMDEYKLYLPFALNAALIMAWLAFIIGSVVITTNNWFSTNRYYSTRKAAKE
jgi:hypothetical protein